MWQRVSIISASIVVVVAITLYMILPHGGLPPGEIARIRSSQGGVACVAFSPDGAQVIAGAGRDVWLSNWATTRRGWHHTYVKECAISIGVQSDDGSIVVVYYDGFVEVLDRASGTVVKSFQTVTSADARFGRPSPVSEDGTRIAGESGTEGLRVWDVQSGLPIAVLADGARSDRQCTALAFSPDGTRLAAARPAAYMQRGRVTPRIHVWRIDTGEEEVSFSAPLARISSIALTRDGAGVLIGGGELVLCDVKTGEVLRRMAPLRGPITCLALSKDGRRAFSGSFDGVCCLWDLESGRDLRMFGVEKDDTVYAVQMSPDGSVGVAGSGYPFESFTHAGTVHFWRIPTDTQATEVSQAPQF